MKQKAWSGRFSVPMDKVLEEFNSSVHFDKRLYKYDIKGSIAWAKALLAGKVLKKAECQETVSALTKIESDIESGKLELKKEQEDVHMNIEHMLTERIGETGKKLHTGRSRNDQVATDIRMYLKDEILEINSLIKIFQKTIIQIAKENVSTIMPGYTHMQKAQPILFAHHMMAYYNMLKRDKERLEGCYERADVMPLGSGALAGSSYDIDRKALAKLLGFSKISKNSMDAVSDRDFVIEFISACSLLMVHLSRLSEEIMIWSTGEFNFIELDDSYAMGSSIMPQKKNPDAAELIRGKSGRVFGDLMAVLTMMKGLPLSYNRDLQEDKERLFDAVDTVKPSLVIMNGMIKTMKINIEKMFADTEKGFLTATDLADYLVKKGVPFREAHETTGNIVKDCIATGKSIFQLSKKELKKYCDKITEDIHDCLTVAHSIGQKNITGGTSKSQVLKAIAEAREELRGA